MIGIVLLNQVLKDTSTLEQADQFAIGEGVREGGDTAVGVDLEEPGFFLGVGFHVDLVDFVREAVIYKWKFGWWGTVLVGWDGMKVWDSENCLLGNCRG